MNYSAFRQVTLLVYMISRLLIKSWGFPCL